MHILYKTLERWDGVEYISKVLTKQLTAHSTQRLHECADLLMLLQLSAKCWLLNEYVCIQKKDIVKWNCANILYDTSSTSTSDRFMRKHPTHIIHLTIVYLFRCTYRRRLEISRSFSSWERAHMDSVYKQPEWMCWCWWIAVYAQPNPT